MSDTPPNRPLVLAMAQAGYEFMVDADKVNVPALHDPLLPWENQSVQLRAEWEGCARAMIEAGQRFQIETHPLMAIERPEAPPPSAMPPRRRWLAVLRHPYLEGVPLYGLEYEESPRVYEKGRAEHDRLIERVELPLDFAGGLLEAVQWWKARTPAPAPEPAKESPNADG